MIRKYIIISNINPLKLEKSINRMLKTGGQIIGGLQVTQDKGNPLFCQAMLKPLDEKMVELGTHGENEY